MDRYSSMSRYSAPQYPVKPLFSTLNTPSAAQDKPFAPRPAVAQTVLDLPEPVAEPPRLEQLPTPFSSTLDPVSGMDPQQSSMLRNLYSAQPNMHYAPHLLKRAQEFGQKGREFSAIAEDFAPGGRHDSALFRWLPRFKTRLAAQRSEALQRALQSFNLEAEYSKAAYDVASNARQNDINAANVAQSGMRGFRSTPSYGTNELTTQANALANAETARSGLVRALNTTQDPNAYQKLERAVSSQIADGGISSAISADIAEGMEAIASRLNAAQTDDEKKSLMLYQAGNATKQMLEKGMDYKSFDELVEDGAFQPLLNFLPPKEKQALIAIQNSFPSKLIENLTREFDGDRAQVVASMEKAAREILARRKPIDFSE